MKNKIIKIGIFFAIILLTIFTIYQMNKYETINSYAKETNLKALENTGIGTLAPGEPDPNAYSYHTNTGIWEAIYGQNSFNLPIYGDFQIYCINPGSPLDYDYELLYDEAKALEGKTYQKDCGVCAEKPHNGEMTPPRYVPVETGELPPAIAYIVSDEPIGQWSEDKQRAMWNLRDVTDANGERLDGGLIIGDADSKNAGPSSLDQEAIDYAEYDGLVRDKGLQPTDKTDINSVYTKVNQDTQEYIVGPFSIEYTNGIYGEIAFSGISEMTVIGYNSKGEVVNDNIEITRLILSDSTTGLSESSIVPEYFEPSEDLKVDETQQVYPKPGQSFQVVFNNPNSESGENGITSISIKVKFKYMLANGKYTKLQGTKYQVTYNCNHDYNPHTHYDVHTHESIDHNGCETTCKLKEYQQQWLMAADAIRSIYEQELEIGKGVNISMDLGGHVWEDVPSGKENIADGQSGILLGKNDAGDKAIPNVKVTLYSENGEIAKLLSDPTESGISNEQIMNRVNPTYTDSEGNYLFQGLDPMRKYYVTFEYNGQVYLPTEYLKTEKQQYTSVSQMVNAGLYNTNEWKVTSKGTESENDRNAYNEQFKEIGSSPVNYKSTDSLNSGKLTNGYNEAFSQYELMGFVLDENGNYYKDENLALIDGFYEISDGNIVETNTLQEGLISKKVKEYITQNKAYPNDEAMKNIYANIAGNNDEVWRKLQFIEDCKIESYTQPQGGVHDLYPVYNQFKINCTTGTTYTTASQAQNTTFDMNAETVDGVTYNIIYPGQFFVNQGLWRRQEADMALRKDIAYAATRINGRTEVYKYDKRSLMTDEEVAELARLRAIYEQDKTNQANYQAYLDYKEQIENKYYWEIQLRMRDYNNYYAAPYAREIYPADYTYRSEETNKSGADLELYVTYKITIRNSSTSVLTQITEVVDYYDEDYTYVEDLSWVMYKTDSNGDNSEITFTDEEYYNTMDQLSFQGSLQTNAKDINSHTESRYGTDSQQSGMEAEYGSLYVRGLDSKKLASGEEAYIYLTFKVKSDDAGPVILDEDDSLKENYSEINGYSTYYRDGTQLPNNQTKGSNDTPGLIDIDSNPGNLKLEDLQEDRFEKNFEDDTDRAKSIKVTIDYEAIRSINGTVWEDERTQTVSESIIGDGVRQEGEIGVQGATVELVEKLEDGNEYIWYVTTTDANGHYEFRTNENGNVYIIPGNYIIRFHYGDTDATVLTNSNGGSNTVSYNGQDFKSTVYQQDLGNNAGVSNYTDEYYDIQASDAYEGNLSDAKDIWTRRQEVNNYSTSNITNHIAEVLASPYASTINSDLIRELRENTNMVAETAIIVLEGEYNRTETDGDNEASNGVEDFLYGNDLNGNYTLNNVDLGLTERPKAQLELSKKITNVKMTLANGNTLIDTNKSATDITWAPGEPYNLNSQMDNNKYEEYYNQDHRYAYRTEVDKLVDSRYDASHNNGLIKIDMDNELMHGATITISYELAVTNVGETDYEGQDFYYKASGASEIVTTTANVVLDYVANNLQFRADDNTSGGWNTINDVVNSEGLNSNLNEPVEKFNTIIKTENLSTALKPGETTTPVSLILTQLMTAQNTADDRTYNNIAEITTVSNSVGRRMAYSIQGNQDPTAEEPAEVDSIRAEEVIVIPPTGIGEIVVYITVAVLTLAILIVGIIFVKKKVLKK